jgi:hypothetical protein
MVDEELFEFLPVLRYPVLGFEVLVEQRQREVLEVDQRDLGSRISRTLGGDGNELLIEGFSAGATGERQNAWCQWSFLRSEELISCHVRSHDLGFVR